MCPCAFRIPSTSAIYTRVYTYCIDMCVDMCANMCIDMFMDMDTYMDMDGHVSRHACVSSLRAHHRRAHTHIRMFVRTARMHVLAEEDGSIVCGRDA